MAYRFPRPSPKNLRSYLRIKKGAKELSDLLRTAEPGYYSTSVEVGRDVESALEAANEVMGDGAFGTEAINGESFENGFFAYAEALYINTGDTYNATIVYDVREGRFFVTSWGDWLEDHERRYGAVP